MNLIIFFIVIAAIVGVIYVLILGSSNSSKDKDREAMGCLAGFASLGCLSELLGYALVGIIFFALFKSCS